jgi:hypothetical protein
MRFYSSLVVAALMVGPWAQAQSKGPFYRVTVKEVTQEYQYESHPLPAPSPPPSLPGTKPRAGESQGGAYYPPYSNNGGNPVSSNGGTNGGQPPNGGGYPPPNPPVDPLPPLPGGTTGGYPYPTTGYPYPTTPPPPSNQVTLNDFITLGSKVWDFIINNKPNATYAPYRASVVPSGITHWTQLRGWSKPVSRVYRVAFQNMFGMASGSFDYRITFIYGGTYQGKGKYIGQISVIPANVRLATDRSLDVKVEILEPLNFGTEENPVAGVTLQVSWSSPTTVRYQMNSAELFLYGTGEIQNLTDGN